MTRTFFRTTVFAALAAFAVCGTAQAAETPDEAAEIKAALAWAAPIMTGCEFSQFPDEVRDNHSYDMEYLYSGQAPGELKSTFHLIQLECYMAAYNASYIYLAKNDGGYSILSFAEPVMAYDFTSEDHTTLRAFPRVKGYVSVDELVNAEFDPTTNTISEFAKGRGIGDIWTSADWQFEDGAFVLKTYSIDPTEDIGDGPADQSFYTLDVTTGMVTRTD